MLATREVEPEDQSDLASPMSGKKGAVKLTAMQVFEARDRAAKGETLTDIAASMGVSVSCISRAVTGRAHRDKGGPRTHKCPRTSKAKDAT